MFILVSVAIICFAATVTGAPATPDIEEFIEKLLTSERFESLVEKIAERAIEKLKVMQRPDSPKGPGSGPGGRGDSRDTRPNILRNDETNEKLQAKPKTQRTHGTPGKINIQAVKDKFGPLGFDKLSLNYKHFTSNKPFQENTKMTERSVPPPPPPPPSSPPPPKIVELSEKLDDRPDKREFNQGTIKEHSKEMDFTFNKSEEPAKKEEQDAPSFERYKANDKRTNKITDEILELNNNSPERIFKLETYLSRDDNKYNNPPMNSQKQQPRAIDLAPAKSHVKKHNIMPEALSNNRFRANVQNEVNEEFVDEGAEDDRANMSHDEKETVIEIMDQNHSAQDRQREVRRENGKLYMFQQSPDYDEYHDEKQAAEARKSNDGELILDEGSGPQVHYNSN